MTQIPVTVVDATDVRSFECLLPAAVEISRIAVRVAELMHLPSIGWDGRPLSYGLVAKGGLLLEPDSTLEDLNLPSPLTVRLVPEIAAGADDTDSAGDTAAEIVIEKEEDDDFEVVVGEEISLVHDLQLNSRPDVRIDAEVHREIEQFAAANRNRECAGMLLGNIETEGKGRIIHVTAAVPAQGAVGTRASVSISLKAWESMLKVRDLDYGDLRVLGWFHTHAGWGVFMSDSDVFIHRHFFPHPNLIAYVLDPSTGRDGFFYWHEGKIGLCPSYGLVGAPAGLSKSQLKAKAAKSDPQSAAKPLDTRNVTIVVLALAVIYLIVMGSPLDWTRKTETSVSAGKAVVVTREQTPSDEQTYTIGRRDNPWKICNRVYGDGDLAMALMRYNGLSNSAGLQVGQTIKLPPKRTLQRLAERQ